MTEPLIDLEDVRLTLGEGDVRTEILKGVSLTLGIGERLAGQEINGLNEDQLARLRGRSLGIILQAFHLLPTMTALENVSVPLELAGVDEPRGRAAFELEQVGLAHRMAHYPAQLSGGEQQRVAIARATAPRPQLLLADEPTGNLDSKTGAQIIDLLFERAGEAGAGLMVITHDPAVAARARRTVHMSDGRLTHEIEPA